MYEWAPLYTLMRQGAGHETTVHFTPTAVDLQEQTYQIVLSLLDGQGQARWSETREFTTQRRPERFDLAPALHHIGADYVEGLLCVHPRCLTRPADPARGLFLECWVDLSDRAGSYISVPAVPYRGESKQVFAPEEKIIPGVVVNDTQTTRLLFLNPTKRPIQAEVTLYRATGETLSAHCTIPGWGVVHRPVDELLPTAQEHLAGVGSIRVQSDLKVLLFFDFVHRASGVCMGMDHSAPFFMRKYH